MKPTPYREGNPAAPICFIAEAPSGREMAEGRPLVGPAGQVFNECLHQAGLLRSNCSILNVVRTPISSVNEYITKKGQLTDLGRQAAKELEIRLRDYTPNVIVPMGNLALKVVIDKFGIVKHRGSIYPTVVPPGRKAVPTIHPAATLPGRGPYVQRYTIVEDMRKAQRESSYPDIRTMTRAMIVNPAFHEVMAFINSCMLSEVLAFDIEIRNFQVSCIGLAPRPDIAMCIPFVGPAWSETEELAIWMGISDLLSNPDIVKVGQYVMFDVSFLLLRNRIRTVPPIEDIYVMHRVLYPDFPAGLDYIASMYTDIPYYKADRKLWTEFAASKLTAERFYEYNCKDALVTREARDLLVDELREDKGALAAYEDSMANFEPCLFAMSRGLKVNTGNLEKMRREVEEQLKEKEAELAAVSVAPFNPTSPKQCIAYFYGTRGLKPYLNRNTGNPTCDDTALSRIIRKYNLPEARLVQEIRALKKLRDTYLNLQFDPDGRLRCFYNVRGTTTGRLSSSKTVFETGLNLQNLAPQFKYFIEADNPQEGEEE